MTVVSQSVVTAMSAGDSGETLGFIARNLRTNCRSIKEQAYKMLVRPILEYAAPVWDPHLQQDINALEKVQRRAARFVLTRHHNTSSVSEMLNILNWPSLAQRRQDARLRLLYKALNGQSTVHNNRFTFAPKRDRRSHDMTSS